jgi:hypothetical protein
MVNGEWSMVNGEWSMVNGELSMGGCYWLHSLSFASKKYHSLFFLLIVPDQP